MKQIVLIAVVAMTLGASGCTEGKYPLSGETCGPADPVRTLDSNDCIALPGP